MVQKALSLPEDLQSQDLGALWPDFRQWQLPNGFHRVRLVCTLSFLPWEHGIGAVMLDYC